MSKMKEPIWILSQLPSLLLCHVSFCNCLNHLLVLTLVMLCQKHVNMSNMKLKWVHAWKKSIWKVCKLFSKDNYLDKKFGKGEHEWEKACHEVDIWHKKFKTLVKTCFSSKVILFQETLKYVNVIYICYT